MQRLGKNRNGYQGEIIDIQQVLQDIEQVMLSKGWIRDHVALSSETGSHPTEFIAYRRSASRARRNLYLSTGIHGDEPAGPLALLQLLREDTWPSDAALWLCPCLNLTGFPLNRRENHDGIDLNRDYRHLHTAEVRAHVTWLEQQPQFDLTLCLHEDWEAQGFYVYELNPDKQSSFAEKIIERVAEVCPIDVSPQIDNWPANKGVIQPGVNPADRPQWAEAVYLISHKTRLSYTLESPSDFPLSTRVSALATAVRTVLGALSEKEFGDLTIPAT